MPNLLAYGSIIITAAVVTCNARSLPPTDGALKIDVIVGRPVVEGVFLNGRGPWRFLIDTGAETNQLDVGVARKLGLAASFRSEIQTPAGRALVPGGRIGEVTLGSAAASGQEFLFTDLAGVHALAGKVEGVLGQEFLSRFDYLLDLAGHRIVFDAPAPDGGRAAMDLVAGRPAIDTDRGRLVLDSGTGTAILFATTPSASRTRIVTAAGSGAASAVRNLKIRVAGRSYSVAAAYVSRSTPLEDGLLPASTFRAVYVSNSGRYIVLEPSTRTDR
jgi:predicted aspartyl protease